MNINKCRYCIRLHSTVTDDSTYIFLNSGLALNGILRCMVNGDYDSAFSLGNAFGLKTITDVEDVVDVREYPTNTLIRQNGSHYAVAKYVEYATRF